MPVRVRPRALVFSKVASGVFRKPSMSRRSRRSRASLPLNPAAMRTSRGVPSVCLAIFLAVSTINSLAPSAVCALPGRRVAALPVNSHQHKQPPLNQIRRKNPRRAKAGMSPALRTAVSGPFFAGGSPVRREDRGFSTFGPGHVRALPGPGGTAAPVAGKCLGNRVFSEWGGG